MIFITSTGNMSTDTPRVLHTTANQFVAHGHCKMRKEKRQMRQQKAVNVLQ